MAKGHDWHIRIYYEDTDAGGIVYYANYLKFFERARTEWLRHLSIEQDELLDQNIGFVVRKVEMNNHRAARFNQLIRVNSQMTELKKASLTFCQQITDEDNNLLVTADVRVACVRFDNLRATAIPITIREELLRVC